VQRIGELVANKPNITFASSACKMTRR
jgi:hypothetical protein